MGRYSIIRSELWTDVAVKGLKPGGKLFYTYAISSPLSNIAGYYKLPLMQIKTDLCRIDRTTLRFVSEDEDFFDNEVFPMIMKEKHLWEYDFDTEQILLPKYLKYNPVCGIKQILAVSGVLKTLTLCPLHIDFLAAFHRCNGDEAVDKLDRAIVDQIKEMAKDRSDPESLYISSNITLPF